MNNSSYIFKKIYKKRKNNSSTIASNNSIIHKNNINTYDLDKKERSINSNENSFAYRGLKYEDNFLNSNKRHKNNMTGNKLLLNAYPSESLLKTFKNEFYSGIKINKAPTYYNNKNAINQIIQKKKIEKLIDYDNFYNRIKINNSKLFKNRSHYVLESPNSRNLLKTNYKMHENKSCDDVISNVYKKNKNQHLNDYNIEDDEKQITDNNFPNIINNKSNNKLKESTIIEPEQITENKDFFNNSVMVTLLPYIPSSKNKTIYNFNLCVKNLKKENDEEIKLYNFATQKMSHYLFEALETKTKNLFQFTDLEKRIIKLKLFQKIHNQNLQKILDSEKFNIEKKQEYLLSLLKKYNNIWSSYRKTINLYLHFLFDKQSEMQATLELIIKTKRDNESKIEKLMIQSVKRQKDLEDLVKIRNFLLQVKQKLIEQPPYYAPLLHRDSRKIQLGNILLKSTVGTKNSSVIKFLDSFSILNLVQLYEIHPSNSTMKLIRKKMNNNFIIPKEYKEKYVFEEHLLKNKENYIPKKGEIIFENVDQFLIIFQNLERKNLMLLEQNNDIKMATANIKRKYEGTYETGEDEKNSQIYLDVIEKMEKLQKVKEKNRILEERYKSVTSLEFNDNNNYTKKLVQQQQNSSFVDLNFFKMINYLKLLNNYKYHGVLLLEKLITIIKTFISCKYGDYNLERCYKMVGMVDLDNILKMNKKYFNEKNKFMVYDYSLKLIKLYDDICEYVKYRQAMYESNKKNKLYMKKKNEEVQNLRKISNAREIRELLDDKRERTIEKILDKWKRPVNRILRKIDDKFDVKLSQKYRNKSMKEIERQRRIFFENEFRDLVCYD